jgi:hypothetical protein
VVTGGRIRFAEFVGESGEAGELVANASRAVERASGVWPDRCGEIGVGGGGEHGDVGGGQNAELSGLFA